MSDLHVRSAAANPSPLAPAAHAPEGGAHPLSQRSRLALVLLGNAISFGALADALLRTNGLGLNVTIGVAVLALVMVMLAKARDPELRLRDHWLAIPVLCFGAAFAWRDTSSLAVINLFLLVSALVIWAAAVSDGRAWDVRAARVRDYVAALAANAVSVAGGIAPVLVADIEYDKVSRATNARRLVAYVRGAVLAIPLLFVFGSLLVSADPVFGRLLGQFISVDLEELLGHLVITGVFAWLAGGYLRGALVGSAPATARRTLAAAGQGLSVGIVEVGCVLGSLSALFLMFVLVQLHYFFGGAATVQATAGLTYAEYARRGFFELVFVAALALPLLLAAGALLRRERPSDERIFRWLSAGMLALLHVVMLSAVRRMWLYQSEYGLTEDRLYASAFMGWLFVVFTWFELTVLRGRPRHFAFGALVALWGVGGALNALNPHALIARTNVERLRDGKIFDAAYVGGLSADAEPVLLKSVTSLTGVPRCQVAQALRQQWVWEGGHRDPADWRAWTLGWRNAERARDRHLTARHLAYGPALAEGGCILPREGVRREGKAETRTDEAAGRGRGAAPAALSDTASGAQQRTGQGAQQDVDAVNALIRRLDDAMSPRLTSQDGLGVAALNDLFAPGGRLVVTRRVAGEPAERIPLDVSGDSAAALTPQRAQALGLSAARLPAEWETRLHVPNDGATVLLRLAYPGQPRRSGGSASVHLTKVGGQWRIEQLLWVLESPPADPAAAR